MEEDCEVMDMDVDELLEQEEYECIKQKSFHDDDDEDDDVIEEVCAVGHSFLFFCSFDICI